MAIETTEHYFGLTQDQLLEIRNDANYTKEECLLFDEGLNVTFFDDMNELDNEMDEFERWYDSKNFEIKAILETINGRIAVVLI